MRLLDVGANAAILSHGARWPMQLATTPAMVQALLEGWDSDEGNDSASSADSNEDNDSVLSYDSDDEGEPKDPLTWMIAGGVPIETIQAVIDLIPEAAPMLPEEVMLQACISQRLDVIRLLTGPELLHHVVDSVGPCISKILVEFNETTDKLVMSELVSLLAFQGGLEEEYPDSLTHNHFRLWLGYCLNPFMPGNIVAIILACALRRFPQIIPGSDEYRAEILDTLDVVKAEPYNEEAAYLATSVLTKSAVNIIMGFDMEFLFDSGVGGDNYATLFRSVLGEMPRANLNPPPNYECQKSMYWGRAILDQIMPGIVNSPGNICDPASYIVLSLWRPTSDGTRASLTPPVDAWKLAQKVATCNEQQAKIDKSNGKPSLFERTL